MQASVCGWVWYRESDYQRILEIFEDSDKMPGTFDEWLRKTEAGVKQLEDRGVKVVRVIIDPDTFPAWCSSKKLKVNAEARKLFANHKAMESIQGSN